MEPCHESQLLHALLLRSINEVRTIQYTAEGKLPGQKYLLISVSNHIPDSPALIFEQVSQGGQEDAVAGLLLLGDLLRDRDENVYRKQAHTVLLIGCEMLEQGYHFVDNDLSIQFFDEFRQIVPRLSPHHRCVVMHEASIVLPKSLL